MDKFWLSIASSADESHPWVGQAERDSNKGWKAELVRPAPRIRLKYGSIPSEFEDISHLNILYDLQTPATLLYPYVSGWGSFTIDKYTKASRDKYTLRFSSLIKNIHLKSMDEKIFAGVSCSSKAFSAWFDSDIIKLAWTGEFQALTLTADRSKQHKFYVRNLGEVTVTEGIKAGIYIATDKPDLEQVTSFGIEFSKPLNARETIIKCFALEHLFAFLVGVRTTFPDYSLTITSSDKSEAKRHVIEGQLFVGTYKSDTDDIPSRSDRFITRHDTHQGIEDLLFNYIDKIDHLIDVVPTLNSIEYEADLLSRFRRLIPVTEDYFLRRYEASSKAVEIEEC
jgi:hypothetical protein